MDSNDIIAHLASCTIPSYYKPLQILLANRDWMPRFLDENGQERIVIIQISNMTDKALDAIHIAAKKWQELTDSFRVQYAEDQSRIKALVERVATALIKEPSRFPASMLSRNITEAITGNLFLEGLTRYAAQESFFDDDKMLEKLCNPQLNLIEPWFQAGVCGHCLNLELLLSSFPRKQSKCSICDRDMSIIRMYRLNPKFEIHKLKNKDLSLYVAAYIQQKKPDVTLEVSKKIPRVASGDNTASSSDITTDIDVHLPLTKTGFESKLFVNSQPQGTQFDNNVAELVKNFEKYSQYGIERLIALTNLSEEQAKKMAEHVEAELKRKGVKYTTLKISHFSFENLISILEEELEEVEGVLKAHGASTTANK